MRKGYRTVSELAVELNVSDMTVRRYLDELEKRELITRTHGGAFVGEEMIDVDYRVRETVRRTEKELIGKLASSLIESGESIYIDSGSTAVYVALAINDNTRITVVTNSMVVAETLESKSNIETILLGGRLHAATHSVIGPLTQDAVTQFRFSKAFLGAAGVDVSQGLSQGNLDEVPIKKMVAQNSKQRIVVVDSSKFRKQVLIMFLPFSEVDILITDAEIPDSDRKVLEETGVRVLIAGMDSNVN